ncbi:hypothetical protein, partial [Sphingobium yanoikuyae]|uniref:hypothetical protein n=1 Tax=Sphingobium yanoikuyae TaxID=13690 RepID=UPI0035C7DE8B
SETFSLHHTPRCVFQEYHESQYPFEYGSCQIIARDWQNAAFILPKRPFGHSARARIAQGCR